MLSFAQACNSRPVVPTMPQYLEPQFGRTPPEKMVLTVKSKISYRHFLQKFTKSRVGKKRQAVAAQIEVFREEARVLFDTYDVDASGVLSRKQLRRMMEDMADGEPVSVAAVSFALATVDKGFDDEEGIGPDDIGYAIAMWKCMSTQQAMIDEKFEQFDVDKTGTLSHKQVRRLLSDLNGDVLVSDAEVNWVIEAADVEGDGNLSREEVLPAVALWYISVGPSDLHPVAGKKTLIPWVYSVVLGLGCAFLVAATTVLWSEQKTAAWLEASALGLFWKLFVMDPAKTLCCGTLLEPIFTLLFGAGAEDAALNTAADQIDGALEDAADLGEGLQGLIDGAEEVGDATADIVADGGGWGQQVRAATGLKQATMVQNMVAFHGYGAHAGKLKHKLTRNRARRKSIEQLEQITEENNKVQSQLVVGRSRSSTMYAEKVRQKRLQRGLSVGKFVAKAEMDAKVSARHLSGGTACSTASDSGEILRSEAWQEASDHRQNINVRHSSSRAKMLRRLNQRRATTEDVLRTDGQAAMDSFKATATGGHGVSHPLGICDEHTGFEVAVVAVEEEQDAVAAFLAGLGDDDSDPSTPPEPRLDRNLQQPNAAAAPDVYDFLRGLDSDSDADGDELGGYLRTS